MTFKYDKNTSVLQCFAYAIKHSELSQNSKLKELIGKEDDEEEVYGDALEIVFDLSSFGGIAYFAKGEADLYEKDNTVEVTNVYMKDGLDFSLIIPYKDFKTLYYTKIKEVNFKENG
jgi:hypothetical protein